MRFGWQRPDSRSGLYVFGFAVAALTGFILAAGNDWWWPGLLLALVAVTFALVVLRDSRRKGKPQKPD